MEITVDLLKTDLKAWNKSIADGSKIPNLRGANLRGANLEGANLRGAKLPHYQIIPQEGEFVAFKKVTSGSQRKTIKLLIAADAERTSSLVGRKCRASKVKVLEGSGWSPTANTKIEYREGKTVEADSFDPDPRIECSHGIHFFVTKEEAEEWV